MKTTKKILLKEFQKLNKYKKKLAFLEWAHKRLKINWENLKAGKTYRIKINNEIPINLIAGDSINIDLAKGNRVSMLITSQ